MGKTARGCRAQQGLRFATASGDPAMAFIPPGCEWATFRPFRFPAVSYPPDSGGRLFGVRLQRAPIGARQSAADIQPLDQVLVTCFVALLDVVEQLATLRHELQQPAA